MSEQDAMQAVEILRNLLLGVEGRDIRPHWSPKIKVSGQALKQAQGIVERWDSAHPADSSPEAVFAE